MNTRTKLITLIVILFIMFSQAAYASAKASILYDETDLGNGYWQYDYTFTNLSAGSEYLYGVQLYFDGLYKISNASQGGAWGGSWGRLNSTSFLETHSRKLAQDISSEASLSGFSFKSNWQVGDISYAAFFDDHIGNRLYTTGTTASNNFSNAPITTAPEPVSTVLFLTGAATMSLRYRQKRKKFNNT